MKRATDRKVSINQDGIISIHALVKRATFGLLFLKSCSSIFQSTPSWRGRRRKRRWNKMTNVFQSTPSWRGRLGVFVIFVTSFAISIHALVKRVTLPLYHFSTLAWYFNPRPREEGDSIAVLSLSLSAIFQSTPSWRGRQMSEYW